MVAFLRRRYFSFTIESKRSSKADQEEEAAKVCQFLHKGCYPPAVGYGSLLRKPHPLSTSPVASLFVTPTFSMPAVGPSLPPSFTEKRKRDESDDSDPGRSSSPGSTGKKPRVMGPSMPPAPLDERPLQSPTEDMKSNDTTDESSDDDDFGPALPTAADAAKKAIAQPATEAPALAALQRDEWMTMAPTNGDWSSRVDPTQLKTRKFNTGKGAKAPTASAGPDDGWYETPEQKQARLQRELMGTKDKNPPSTAKSKPAPNSDDRAMARRLESHSAVRGPSLFDAHQKKQGREEDDDPSKRAFDREKDIAGGLQLNSTQRRDMMKKASDFGSRFSSSKYL